MNNQKKADECAAKLKDALKDFPAHLLFCVGSEGGFSSMDGVSDELGMHLGSQILETLTKNPAIADYLRLALSQVDNNANTKIINGIPDEISPLRKV